MIRAEYHLTVVKAYRNRRDEIIDEYLHRFNSDLQKHEDPISRADMEALLREKGIIPGRAASLDTQGESIDLLENDGFDNRWCQAIQ